MEQSEQELLKETRDKRPDFLIEMYKQLLADINRHIIVVWQSVGVLIGGFAVISLVEKNIIDSNWAASFIIGLSTWLIAHVHDSNYWYNRNLVMIANIERLFLDQTDKANVHHYFVKHRPSGKFIDHLAIQFYLGVGVIAVALVFHVYSVARPIVTGVTFRGVRWLDLIELLPVLMGLLAWVVHIKLKASYEKKYQEFKERSPGIQVGIK